MSSQAGILNFDGTKNDLALLEKLTQAMLSYGPDGGEVYQLGPIGMSFRAFHTTRESQIERQPLVSRFGPVMMFDGRLDNREDLIDQLSEQSLRRKADVEIVMEAYIRWGRSAFSKIIGDWAITVWDPINRTLILARDYMGIRSLYYRMNHQKFSWCTHLLPLIRLHSGGLTLQEKYITEFLTSYPPTTLTPFTEILPVPPGFFLCVTDGVASLYRHWSFNWSKTVRYKSDAEYEDHFRFLFRNAIRRRLRASGPVLADLSGGLDSSSIVCMADRILKEGASGLPQIDTFSFCNLNEPGAKDDPYIRIVEEMRGREGIHFDCGPYADSVISLDHSSLAGLPSSMGGWRTLQTRVQALMAEGGYRVGLSGTGGDEFLGGVPDPRSQLADMIVQCRFRELWEELIRWSLAKRRPWIQLLFDSLKAALTRSFYDPFNQRRTPVPWINPNLVHRFHGRGRIGSKRRFSGITLPSRREAEQTISYIAQQRACSELTPGQGEQRYPYLDQDLVEFLTAIPPEQLLRPFERRSLMRRALVGILPSAILTRKTKALVSSSFLVFVDNHFSELESLFVQPISGQFGFLQKARFLQALHAVRTGNASHLMQLRRAISLELWLRALENHHILASPGRKYKSRHLEQATQLRPEGTTAFSNGLLSDNG